MFMMKFCIFYAILRIKIKYGMVFAVIKMSQFWDT